MCLIIASSSALQVSMLDLGVKLGFLGLLRVIFMCSIVNFITNVILIPLLNSVYNIIIIISIQGIW